MPSETGPSRAVAADYAWTETEGGGLFSAYCLTLVRGIDPSEFMKRLGARILHENRPLDGRFVETSFDYWDEPHYGDVQFIGATTVPGEGGDWTLALEVNGHLGVTRGLAIRVSDRTRLVSHRYNDGNGHGEFVYAEDGDVLVEFEPMFTDLRVGSEPDVLLDDMREIGLNPDPRNEDDDEDLRPTTARAFALAERLTGVRVTQTLLDGAVFLCGEAVDHPSRP